MERAQQVLTEAFGFDQFLPGQAEVIEHLLAGRSTLAIFPTGGGKSLCYQLPALTFDGITIVISPLIALMKDQIDVLKSRGIPAERLDSTLSADETRSVMLALRSGELRLLYVAPERFNNERFLQAIMHTRISMFAVDEAHCISEWGHNFRPDYLKLARFARSCRAERLFALTATAGPKVAEDICKGFGIPGECVVRTGFYRKNLTVLTTPITAADRDKALLERLKGQSAGAHNRLCYTTKDGRASSSVFCLGGTTGTSLSCWDEKRSADRSARLVHGFRRWGRGGNHCFRHGNRQVKHPLHLSL